MPDQSEQAGRLKTSARSMQSSRLETIIESSQLARAGHEASADEPPALPSDGEHLEQHTGDDEQDPSSKLWLCGCCASCCEHAELVAEIAATRAISTQPLLSGTSACCSLRTTSQAGSSRGGAVYGVSTGDVPQNVGAIRRQTTPVLSTRHLVHSRSVQVCFWTTVPILVILQVVAICCGYVLFGTFAPFYFRFRDSNQHRYGDAGGPFAGIGTGEDLGENPSVANAVCISGSELVIDLRFAKYVRWDWPEDEMRRNWLVSVMLDRMDMPTQFSCPNAAFTGLHGAVYLAPILSGNTSFATWPQPGDELCRPEQASRGGGPSQECLRNLTQGATPGLVPNVDRPVRGFVAVLVPPDSQLSCPHFGDEAERRQLLATSIAAQAGVSIEGFGEGRARRTQGTHRASARVLSQSASASGAGSAQLLGSDQLVYRGPLESQGWAALARTAEHVRGGVLGSG